MITTTSCSHIVTRLPTSTCVMVPVELSRRRRKKKKKTRENTADELMQRRNRTRGNNRAVVDQKIQSRRKPFIPFSCTETPVGECSVQVHMGPEVLALTPQGPLKEPQCWLRSGTREAQQ
jgi:hypothetical protein